MEPSERSTIRVEHGPSVRDNKYGLLLMFQYLASYRAYYKRLNLLRKVVEIDNYVVVAIELEALGESEILSLRENSREVVVHNNAGIALYSIPVSYFFLHSGCIF